MGIHLAQNSGLNTDLAILCAGFLQGLPSVYIPEWWRSGWAIVLTCLGNSWVPLLVLAEKTDLYSLPPQVMTLLGCGPLTPGSLPAPSPMFYRSISPFFLQPSPDSLTKAPLTFSVHMHREKPVLPPGALRTLRKPRKECSWLTRMLCDLWQVTVPL